MTQPTTGSPNALQTLISDMTANAKVAAHELGEIKTAHMNLAKAEVSQNIAKPAVKGIAMFAVAAVLGLNALTFLLITAALGIAAAGLPFWAGFGIMTLLLLLIVGILAFVGLKAMKNIQKPERSINAGKQFAARMKGAMAQG